MRVRWAALGLIASMALLLANCGGGSGQPAPNPTPAIGAVFPPDITAGSALFKMNISGSGFLKDVTQAFWNGAQRDATLNVSTGQLAVTVLASDVAVAGQAQIIVENPAPGGGPSTSLTFVINPAENNAATITGFNPVDTPAATKLPFTLTVNGTNFMAPTGNPPQGSTILWNATLRTTTFVDSTTITTSDFSSADLANCGPISVTVDNPGTNNGIIHSVSVDFNITGNCNPVPAIVSISPPSTTVGVVPAGGTLTINGFDFMTSAIVFFNGTQRTPASGSGTQITVPITGADVAAAGTIVITVSNPTPGGGVSAAGIFTIGL